MSTIESIALHIRTYRSALKSTLEVTVSSLASSHLKMNSILHPLGSDPKTIDFSAIIYSLLRLPGCCLDRTKLVLVAQTTEIFAKNGFPHVDSWPRVTSPARRRTCNFHLPTRTLAVFASSISDLDDLTNLLIAYQSEWNKFHVLLAKKYSSFTVFKKAIRDKTVLKDFNIDAKDWHDFLVALGPKHPLRLRRIYQHSQDLHLRLLAGSWIDYTKSTQRWWKNISTVVSPSVHLSRQKIYFVSGNTHSLLNLVTGFALKSKNELIKLAPKNYTPDTHPLLHPNDFLYYLSKFYLKNRHYQQSWLQLQKSLGILTIPSTHNLDVSNQIFPIKSLPSSKYLDPRLKISRPAVLEKSNAVIFNIDYPLGFAAYHALNEILENVAEVRGVYILGKSAVLNSEIGDIQIPRLVFDEHSQNSYFFKNCFNTFFPFTNTQGSILTNQKSVSVIGTFLENPALMAKYSKNNLTVIEMESGPYLSAITEATYDQQAPRKTMVDLNSAPFDIGIINYTSDTPYSKAKNLGAGSLNLAGVQPVYLGSLAILQRIINLEENQ